MGLNEAELAPKLWLEDEALPKELRVESLGSEKDGCGFRGTEHFSQHVK